VALDADVLGRVAGADDQEFLAGKLDSSAKIVRVHDALQETVKTLELWHVGCREVTCAVDDAVEFLANRRVRGEIPGLDHETARRRHILDPAHGVIEAQERVHA
jgi:hypothetical protein